MRKTMLMLLLCLAGTSLNITLGLLMIQTATPLFMDTIFTVALTLLGGLGWGVLTGLLTNVVGQTILHPSWEMYLFAICNMLTALITWLFTRFFPRELNLRLFILPVAVPPSTMAPLPRATPPPVVVSPAKDRRFGAIMDRTIVLILLSFCLCLVMSISGGIISAIAQTVNPIYSGELTYPIPLGDGSSHEPPLLIREISSRIPINIINRLIDAFAGFGIALGIALALRRLAAKAGQIWTRQP